MKFERIVTKKTTLKIKSRMAYLKCLTSDHLESYEYLQSHHTQQHHL